MHSLKSFCEAILDDPRYSLLHGIIGLNADLAHWAMSGDIGEHLPAIRDRIVHAHISGHHPTSHFGDTELTEEMTARYQPLLKHLRQLRSMEEVERRSVKHLPQYSGYISLEYEAAPDLAAVQRSLECVQSMLSSCRSL